MRWEKALEERFELVQGQVGRFEEMRQRAPFDWPVSGHGDLQNFGRCMLLEADVTTALADNHKPRPLQGPDDLEVRETGNDAQRVTSANCRWPVRTNSSSTGSR